MDGCSIHITPLYEMMFTRSPAILLKNSPALNITQSHSCESMFETRVSSLEEQRFSKIYFG